VVSSREEVALSCHDPDDGLVSDARVSSSDVVWSDPNDGDSQWTPSARHLLDAGECYGADVCTKFLHANGLDLVCRAHQLAMEGYFYSFEKKNSLTGQSAREEQQSGAATRCILQSV
jgi:diadenosine tetraphosphatase ApaH/serine/threonine PP2A family protein phosphatase